MWVLVLSQPLHNQQVLQLKTTWLQMTNIEKTIISHTSFYQIRQFSKILDCMMRTTKINDFNDNAWRESCNWKNRECWKPEITHSCVHLCVPLDRKGFYWLEWCRMDISVNYLTMIRWNLFLNLPYYTCRDEIPVNRRKKVICDVWRRAVWMNWY